MKRTFAACGSEVKSPARTTCALRSRTSSSRKRVAASAWSSRSRSKSSCQFGTWFAKTSGANRSGARISVTSVVQAKSTLGCEDLGHERRTGEVGCSRRDVDVDLIELADGPAARDRGALAVGLAL